MKATPPAGPITVLTASVAGWGRETSYAQATRFVRRLGPLWERCYALYAFYAGLTLLPHFFDAQRVFISAIPVAHPSLEQE